MYEIRVDTNKNRLYVILDGYLADDKIQEAVNTTKANIDQLKPGFDLINDARNFKPLSPESTTSIAELQKYLIEHGLKQTVRIVGKEVIGAMQLERMTKDTGYDVLFASSIEEAETLLDEQSL
ncbi:hypothetical protein ACFLYO_10230 [Chloroflexota bacterium]